MIVESTSYSSLSKISWPQLKTNRRNMAMNKLSTHKYNGHSKINENSTDDDYGGGGVAGSLGDHETKSSTSK